MPILTGLFLIVAVLLTSTLSGVFGMVGGMFLLWLLLLVMPVTTAIAVQGVIQLIANCSRAYFSRAWTDWVIIAYSTTGLAFAILLLVLVSYTPNIAIVSICIGLLPILVWMPVRSLHLDASRPTHAIVCGFISGAMNIGVGVSGPFADIFFVRTEMDRRQIIATKAALQVLSHIAKIIYYSGSLALLAGSEIISVGMAAPFAILGSVLGHRILARLSNEGFRWGTRWLITFVAAFYLFQGVYLMANN